MVDSSTPLHIIGTTASLDRQALDEQVQAAAHFLRNHFASQRAGSLTPEQELQFLEACEILDSYGEGSDVHLKELAGG